LVQRILKLKELYKEIETYYRVYAAEYYSIDNLASLEATDQDYLAFGNRMKEVASLDAFGLH
jgi:hypothetical protein